MEKEGHETSKNIYEDTTESVGHCTALLSPQPSRFCDVGGKGSGDKWVENLPTSDGGRSV